MKNDKIDFENQSQIFQKNQLVQKSKVFKMSIKLVAEKEKHFVRYTQIKTNFQEYIDILKLFKTFWKKNVDGTAIQSTDWIY